MLLTRDILCCVETDAKFCKLLNAVLSVAPCQSLSLSHPKTLSTMANKLKSKQEEAMQFLDDLDSLSPGPVAPGPADTSSSQPRPEGQAADVLKFLDEITQKSSEPTRITPSHLDRPTSRAGTPTLRKSTERIRVGTPTTLSTAAKTEALASASAVPDSRSEAEIAQASKGWGWGSVWSSASAALQQAKTVVDEQVKNLPQQEQAKKWSEDMMGYVKKEQLEKLGKYYSTSTKALSH